MTIESAMITLVAAVISGTLATIITIVINNKKEAMRDKKQLVSEIFGYRFLINRKEGAEKFYVALNRVPIVFCNDSYVIDAYDKLFDVARTMDVSERYKNMDDSLVSLMKALCKATRIKCDNWNDSKVLNVFGD